MPFFYSLLSATILGRLTLLASLLPHVPHVVCVCCVSANVFVYVRKGREKGVCVVCGEEGRERERR